MSAAAALLLVKGVLSDLPEEDKKKIEGIAQSLRNIVEANGEHGELAFALYGAQYAAEEELKEKAGKK